MEWLKTLIWVFRGGEKELIAFVALIALLMFGLPFDHGSHPPMQPADASQLEKQEMQ